MQNWKRFVPIFVVLLFAASLTSFFILKYSYDLDQMKQSYIHQQTQEVEKYAAKIEEKFRAFYQGLRVISLLPGVRKIDRYGENFSGDSKIALQQIYNNTYLNVQLSEIYLLPESLNPEKIDSNTGKPEEPIMTFDKFIVGKFESTEEDQSEESIELEEVEEFEYRLMHAHLKELMSNFPNQNSIEGINIPAISGEPVITCDNSEFTVGDFKSGNNYPRLGIVYTVPVFNDNGEFSGGVSGVVRVNVLNSMLPSSTHALINTKNNFLYLEKAGKELKEAQKFFEINQSHPELIFSMQRKLDVVDNSEWQLWVALPDQKFYDLEIVGQAKSLMIYGIIASLIIGLLIIYMLIKSANYQASLEGKIKEKTAELSQRNRDMRLILDNAEEGFLICDLQGQIGREYSKIIEKWFHIPGENCKIWELLLKDATGDKSKFFKLGWDQMVEEWMPFEVSADQMLKRFDKNGQIFESSYYPIRNAAKLNKILIVIENITSRVLAERQEKSQKELISVISKINEDRSGFLEFFADAESIVQKLVKTPFSLNRDDEFRLIHTLKGNCAQYGLTSVSEICHELESILVSQEQQLDENQIVQIKVAWDATYENIKKLIGENKKDTIELHKKDYLHVLELIKNGAEHSKIANEIEKWRFENVSVKLNRFKQQIVALGHRLKQQNIKVIIEDNAVRLIPDSFKEFWTTLSHVVRNAVDHGISAQQKNPEITIKTFIKNDILYVSVKDNGKGIDWEGLRKKAIEKKLPHHHHSDLVNCIFSDGITTRSETTEISGRGVGMAAVKQSVLKYGGSIEVHSLPEQGTEFIFCLPLQKSHYYLSAA